MILSCHNICKSFGTDEILNHISFHIEDHEKAAIIGINGAGKSTLLKIIMNEMQPDSGEVILSKGKSIGYLAQHQSLSDTHTIYETMLEVKKDIIETYGKENLYKCKKFLKNKLNNNEEYLYNKYGEDENN